MPDLEVFQADGFVLEDVLVLVLFLDLPVEVLALYWAYFVAVEIVAPLAVTLGAAVPAFGEAGTVHLEAFRALTEAAVAGFF